MDKSYIKSIYGDLWDEYQLKVAVFGGNKPFWDWMKLYNMETRDIYQKYGSKSATYYKRRLASTIQGKEFTEQPPAKNAEELMDKGLQSAKVMAKKAEVGLTTLGSKITEKY